MKKIVILIAFIFSSLLVTAQNNTIAKFKFEEAEELFSNEYYFAAIDKLDEVEKMLNSTNPKILYLKILSQSKIVENMPYHISQLTISDSFGIIDEIRININKYLIEYENLSGSEEKYRDVYKISETVKHYPNTKNEYYDWARPLLQKENAQYIIARIQVARRDNKNINFVFEVVPEKYDFIIINGKQYYFSDLYPVFEGQTFEQWKDRCKLIVQENGSIFYDGIVFLDFNNKKNAEAVCYAIKELQSLTYEE